MNILKNEDLSKSFPLLLINLDEVSKLQLTLFTVNFENTER